MHKKKADIRLEFCGEIGKQLLELTHINFNQNSLLSLNN